MDLGRKQGWLGQDEAATPPDRRIQQLFHQRRSACL
jgi:hypothetical protein